MSRSLEKEIILEIDWDFLKSQQLSSIGINKFYKNLLQLVENVASKTLKDLATKTKRGKEIIKKKLEITEFCFLEATEKQTIEYLEKENTIRVTNPLDPIKTDWEDEIDTIMGIHSDIISEVSLIFFVFSFQNIDFTFQTDEIARKICEFIQ